MDAASQALAQSLPTHVRRTYTALAECSDVKVSRTTVWYRDKGRPSRLTKAQSQQYLTSSEEKALVQHVLRTAALGFPLRIKDIPLLAFSIARRRSATKAIKPPNKNWPQAFAKRHPQLARRNHRAMDWNRHDNNIYPKSGQPLPIGATGRRTLRLGGFMHSPGQATTIPKLPQLRVDETSI
jgi:hypothetical protein